MALKKSMVLSMVEHFLHQLAGNDDIALTVTGTENCPQKMYEHRQYL